MIERELVLKKLTQYLNSEISRTDVHAWALSVAVAREFDQEADPLVTMTVHSLIDISHDNLKKIPSRRALEYYRLCLEGRRRDPFGVRSVFPPNKELTGL